MRIFSVLYLEVSASIIQGVPQIFQLCSIPPSNAPTHNSLHKTLSGSEDKMYGKEEILLVTSDLVVVK